MDADLNPHSHCCEQMRSAVSDDDLPLEYAPKFREYGILYCDDGSSYQLIQHCPWCGSQLPASLREAWFDELDRLGLEPEDPMPDELRDGRWWKQGPSQH
ncbi:MAG: hypothetical protein U1E12_02505 [Hydrogenophaga sp.]|uniref:DUF6980 family protein n=1 Tax=Hydrogenophaga sp. TaxID=1904254 RepID=UPI002AB92CD5|nr:hypothetical protein [Hydrogenophaga sp.]MDZ4100530.1 hypothetical protein [Hydrogenophaga sp.]